MKKLIMISILLTGICLMGCENKRSQVVEKNIKDTIFFLGRPIVDNDSVYEQISAIADEDEMLSYSDSVLQIGDVRWGINVRGPKLHISLLTSVQPNTPEMKQVVQYLIGIYGEPFDNCEGDDEYIDLIWPAYNDSTTINQCSARLRRIKGEQGGTVFF